MFRGAAFVAAACPIPQISLKSRRNGKPRREEGCLGSCAKLRGAAHAARHADDVDRERRGDGGSRRRAAVDLSAGAGKPLRRLVGICAPVASGRRRRGGGGVAGQCQRSRGDRHGLDHSRRCPEVEGLARVRPSAGEAALGPARPGRLPGRGANGLSRILRPAAQHGLHHPCRLQFRGGSRAVARRWRAASARAVLPRSCS